MIRWLASLNEGVDNSVHAYGAVIMCACSMAFGVAAIRSHRDAGMMRTEPATKATILALHRRKSVFNARIAFIRIVDGTPLPCQTQVVLKVDGNELRVGSVLPVIPRADSCGEPVIVGERNTWFLAAISGLSLLMSLVLGILSAQSMLRKARGGAVE